MSISCADVGAENSLVLSCQVTLDGIVLVILNPLDSLKPCVTHTVPFGESLRGKAVRSSTRTWSPPATVERLIEALDNALDWLCHNPAPIKHTDPITRLSPNLSSWSSRIGTITVSSELEAPILLPHRAQNLLSSISPVSSLRTHMESLLKSPFLIFQNNCDETVAQRCQIDIENAMAQRLGHNICEGLCLFSDQASNRHMTRLELRTLMANRLGAALSSSSWPVQLLRHRRLISELHKYPGFHSHPYWMMQEDSWLISAGSLVISVLLGRIAPLDLIEACQSTMYHLQSDEWDDALIAVISDLAYIDVNVQDRPELSSRPKDWPKATLPAVSRSALRSPGHVSPYLSARCRFSEQCIVTGCTPMWAAAFSSHLPSVGDIGLYLGEIDIILVPTHTWVASSEWSILPHPMASEATDTDQPPFVTMTQVPEAAKARLCVRDKYSNASWQVFERVMGTVCHGGSVGIDNKFFAFWQVGGQPREMPLRFEDGILVSEFSDLRANVRCLIEGQALHARAKASRIITRDWVNIHRQGKFPSMKSYPSSLDFSTRHQGIGGLLGFDAYDYALSPLRILAWGRAASNASIADCWTDVVGGAWVCSLNQRGSIRIALGSAFIAIVKRDMPRQDQTGGSKSTAFLRELLRGSPAAFTASTGFDNVTHNQPGTSVEPGCGSARGRSRSASSPARGTQEANGPPTNTLAAGSTAGFSVSSPHSMVRKASMLSLTPSPLDVLDEQEEDSGIAGLDSGEGCSLEPHFVDVEVDVTLEREDSNSKTAHTRRERSSTASASFRAIGEHGSLQDLMTSRSTDGRAMSTHDEELQLRAWLRGKSTEEETTSKATAVESSSTRECLAALWMAFPGPTAERPYRDRRIWPHGHEHMSQLREEQCADESVLGLTTLSSCDEDLWILYGAMIEEHVRLQGVADMMVKGAAGATPSWPLPDGFGR